MNIKNKGSKRKKTNKMLHILDELGDFQIQCQNTQYKYHNLNRHKRTLSGESLSMDWFVLVKSLPMNCLFMFCIKVIEKHCG